MFHPLPLLLPLTILGKVLPVSDIGSHSFARDLKDFMEDPHLPALANEWGANLPLTGRQYLRQVRR